jgi:hypothetical protein
LSRKQPVAIPCGKKIQVFLSWFGRKPLLRNGVTQAGQTETDFLGTA